MSSAPPGPSPKAVLARGAGLALLGRRGALVDVVSFLLVPQRYGPQPCGRPGRPDGKLL